MVQAIDKSKYPIFAIAEKLNSVGRKNEGLGFAWVRSDLKEVTYFAMPMASMKALDTPSETGAGRR